MRDFNERYKGKGTPQGPAMGYRPSTAGIR